MNTHLPASGDHLGRTLGDLTHGQRSALPRYYTNNNSDFDHWNSQLTKFLRHIDQNKGYYCFVDVHFSATDLQHLKSASSTKIRTYREAWNRFLHSDDPGDIDLKPLYASVANHHPDQHLLAGAPEVVPFGVNFAGKLTDSALGFLYRLASIKYPKQQKNWSYKAFRSRWMMHYVRLIQLAVTDSASHAITLGCCHLKSYIDSDVVDDFPSIPYPVDRASKVLPAFQDGRPVHSLRVAHRSIRVPGSVGNYLEQLAQNARTASLAPHVVPEPPSDDGSDWSFLTPSVRETSQPSHSVSDLNSNISLADDWENHPLLQSTQGTTQPDVLSTSDLQDFNSDNLQYDDDDLLEVSKSFDYDWQLTGHCFIGERVSIIYPNGLVGIGTVQKYLPPDGENVALFHVLHDDGDKEDLDCHECFAAMEQYRKNFPNLDSTSPFARHLESKVVTFTRLMHFNRSILVQFLQYLDLDDTHGATRKVLSNQILKAYKYFTSVNSSS
jgi:hypothetical protein